MDPRRWKPAWHSGLRDLLLYSYGAGHAVALGLLTGNDVHRFASEHAVWGYATGVIGATLLVIARSHIARPLMFGCRVSLAVVVFVLAGVVGI